MGAFQVALVALGMALLLVFGFVAGAWVMHRPASHRNVLNERYENILHAGLQTFIVLLGMAAVVALAFVTSHRP